MRSRGWGRAVLRRQVLVASWIVLSGTFAAAQELSVSPRNASYEIEATLDPSTRLVTGRLTLTWRNLQELPTDELWFHLYWNGWRNDQSTWLLEDRYRGRSSLGSDVQDDDWGYLEVNSMRLTGGQDLPTRFAAPDDGNVDDRTVLVATLPEAVAPGESISVDIEWQSKVPRTFARTGYRGEFYFIAHWFPKLGVFEGDGWNNHQFHAATEFYSDYGSYDVQLTVPAGWVVGATGSEVDRRDNGDGTETHRYHEDDVHGFAWTTSPDYVELTRRFEVEGLPPVEMRLLIQPEHLRQAERHFHATSATLELYGRWYGPYPYGHVTMVDPAYGSGSGGMEYPTLFTCGTRLYNPFGGGRPEGVTVHEAGHQFWYGLVGNDEFTSAWLDEGLNTYSTARVMFETYGGSAFVKRYFRPPGTRGSGFFPLLFPELHEVRGITSGRLARYRANASTDVPAQPTWRSHPGTVGNISYSKTAIWLATIENHIGWDRLQPAMAAFFERWRFAHPKPEDFFAEFEEVSDEAGLDSYFEQVFYDDVRFDYAVQSVKSTPVKPKGWFEGDDGLELRDGGDAEEETTYRNEVVVRRLGEGRFPVEVLLVFEDGSEVRRRWDGQYRWHLISEDGASKLSYAEVDPDRVLLLDTNFTNNSRLRKKAPRLVAVKWASKWMIWAQDLLATFASFV